MVTLAGIISPVRPPVSKDVWPIKKECKIKSQRLLDGMAELVRPLSSVTSNKELKNALDKLAPRYLHLKNEFGRIIMNQLEADEYVNLAAQAYDDLRAIIKDDVLVLSDHERELLLEVVEGLREVLFGALYNCSENPGLLNDIILECSPALQRLDMSMLSILLVLTRDTQIWNHAGIKLLSRVANDSIQEIQDIFLLHDSELHERLKNRDQEISLEEVCREVGLPN